MELIKLINERRLGNFMKLFNKLAVGNYIHIETKNSEYSGTVLPSFDKKIIVLKLDNGYNVGLNQSNITNIKELKKATRERVIKSKKQVKRTSLPKVTLITTGGTITSRVDYKTGAVSPLTKPRDLIDQIPELEKRADLCKIINPFDMFSEDMGYKEWQKIAEFVARELNSDAKGVIVTHGTDTLHFTAAALSFMLQDLNKPVAIVGGQRSSDRGSFDGADNLLAAASYCKSDIAEVAVVMHGTSSDEFMIANRGTKVRKMHTSRRDAFRPINSLPLANIHKDGAVEIVDKDYRIRNGSKVKLNKRFEPKIALIKTYPGISPNILDYYIDKNYLGFIIEGTGLGHIPISPNNKEDSWLPKIERAVRHKLFVGVTSQCLYGRTDPFVYENGRLLEQAGAVHLGDMLPETAFVKLGCMLGRTKNLVEVRKLMLKDIASEINPRIIEKSFLY